MHSIPRKADVYDYKLNIFLETRGILGRNLFKNKIKQIDLGMVYYISVFTSSSLKFPLVFIKRKLTLSELTVIVTQSCM